tara:strand:+ start:203 stop:328 length:126 start_codon:yes stop_codon:yes gene_type:complete
MTPQLQKELEAIKARIILVAIACFAVSFIGLLVLLLSVFCC